MKCRFGRCLDYLATRPDVDMSRIAVCGSSLGGFYAARAACYEHRLAAAFLTARSGALQIWGDAIEEHGLA